MEEESEESDIRKRAAWLLAMLAIVAVLLAVVMITFLGGNKGEKNTTALDDPITSTSAGPHDHSSAPPPGTPTTTTTQSGSSGPPASTSTSSGPPSCPTSAVCALVGDAGDAVTAINAYRTAHGKAPVAGKVSKAAQDCAVSNGNNCSGSWAESQVPTANGQDALNKVMSRAHDLLTMTSFEVGWAYDPTGHQCFFAVLQDS